MKISKADCMKMIKENQTLIGIIGYAILTIVGILVGILALKESVVPVCIILLAQTGIAVLLHNVELWIHGIVLLAELIAGVLVGSVLLVVVAIVLYVAALAIMKFTFTGEK